MRWAFQHSSESKIESRIAILAAVVAGVLNACAFFINSFPEKLDYALIPGTVAFILIGGGEAGSTPSAEAVAPYIGGLVNMLFYGLLTFGITRLWKKTRNVRQSIN